MAVLLVDERDGRILAEAETVEDVQRVFEGWAKDDGTIPDYLSLIELRSHQGAIVGTDTSVQIRPLRGH